MHVTSQAEQGLAGGQRTERCAPRDATHGSSVFEARAREQREATFRAFELRLRALITP